jgi:heme/copper-type cytochrome/quinol oxidase subunit 2
MTDTMHAPPAPPEPSPSSRRSVVTAAVAVLAVVAVIALAIVAIVAVSSRDDDHGATMGPNGSMMGGSMMSGPMMGHSSSTPTVPGAREIAVTATSFRFEPAEIHVRPGEDVTVILSAADVAHDFTIDALGVHVSASPGQLGRGGLHAPSTPGRYTAYCSVAGHRPAGMTATVVVDAP